MASRLALSVVLTFAAVDAGAQTGSSPGASAKSILESNCLACHGEAKMSDLDLRGREAMLQGGKRGPSVIPGKAEQSLLYKAVARQGDLKMPPGKYGLSPAEVETIRAWIDAGAQWDAAGARAAEPSWWAFRKPKKAEPPAVDDTQWSRNPIDRFVFARLREKGLKPVGEAGRRTLVRRAHFDLHGLPPSPEEVEQFVNDTSPDAWQQLIERLLASPRYGERWGRHWLDIVRYADTGGFETDVWFANAWRYRDYVIRSFNDDKPFDEFVREQVAADEIWPVDLGLEGSYDLPKHKQKNVDRWVGTGLYTIGALPVEFSFLSGQYEAEWQAEAVDTTAAAFLGLTVACARCHDHKFDPISQRDYYRLSAIFAGSEDREVPIVSRMGIFEYTRHEARVANADQIKARIHQLDGSSRRRQNRELSPTQKDERESLLRQLGEAYLRAPAMYDKAQVLVHVTPVPETHILVRGDFRQKGDAVKPGFPAALGPGPAISEPEGNLFIPQRRKALAEWLTSPENPLLARVMVNRIWQGHFGRGIVGTPNDFGRQGELPTHPELLDWLAVEFVQRGWSVKQVHRLLLNSRAYRLSSAGDEANAKIDPDNHFVWRMNRRRLEAEALRDSVLAAAGSLNLKAGGPPIAVPLTEEERDGMRDPSQWPQHPDPREHERRSVYLLVKRSFSLPMFETFDTPDSSASCARRESSTVAPQALALMNSDLMLSQAERFAARLRKETGEAPEAWVDRGWRIAFGRAPTTDEKRKALDYLGGGSLERLCLLWFNMSEFLYVD